VFLDIDDDARFAQIFCKARVLATKFVDLGVQRILFGLGTPLS
jgi:hypothetical protein